MKNNVKGEKNEGMRKTSTFVKYDVFTTESLWKKWRRIIIRIDMWNGKKYKYIFFFIHKFVVFCRDDNIINIFRSQGRVLPKNVHACKGGSRIKLQTNIIYVFGILKVLKFIQFFFIWFFKYLWDVQEL